MKLQLQYKANPQHPIKAFLIKGAQPSDWLQTINTWNISIPSIECYLLPTSRGNIQTNGLFVVFKRIVPTVTITPNITTYGQVTDRLYVPVQSALTPAIEDKELQQILLYDKQVFHPAIGLVGFSVTDQINLGDLLLYPQAVTADWGKAKAGNTAAPPLQRIQMIQPPPEKLVDSLKDNIGSQPLKDIPKNKEQEAQSESGKLLDNLKDNLLKGGLGMADRLKEALANNGVKGGNEPGMIDRFEKWANDQLKALEEKRKKELDRLMDLFDEDPDEALKYAIPLDNAYQPRGTAAPSESLQERSTDFNLSNIGGGRGADTWAADARYFELRGKYVQAAKAQIEKGEFRKAAYIYAQLLGDFHAAANVLKQGGFYREAAALYKDHLKNNRQAARCLEEGGLLFEAVEIYEDLGKHEKVGDLYTQLEQQEKAALNYYKSVSSYLIFKDHLNAARIFSDKLADTPKAQKVLLDGWKGHRQAEPCLKEYFKQVEKDALPEQLNALYEPKLPYAKKNIFLNVLLSLQHENIPTAAQQTSETIAYTIIGEQVQIGNTARLKDLRAFVPEDQLLPSDVNRFIAQQQSKKTRTPRPKEGTIIKSIHLDRQVNWLESTTNHSDFFLLGKKQQQLYFVRGKWSGELDYHSWTVTIPTREAFHFLDTFSSSQTMLIYGTNSVDLESIIFPASYTFPTELQLHAINWLPENRLGLVKVSENKIVVIVVSATGAIQLSYYDDNGFLESSVDCLLASTQQAFATAHISTICYHKGYIYFLDHSNHLLVRVDKLGVTTTHLLGSQVISMTASTKHTAFRVVIQTREGCRVFRPTTQGFNPVSSLFAEDLASIAMKYIPRLGLVLIEPYRIVVFEDATTSGQPRLLYSFETEKALLAILPMPKRNQCAFLTEGQEVVVYAFN